MTSLLINIGLLAGIHPKEQLRLQGSEMCHIGTMGNAWLHIKDGIITAFGTMESLDHEAPPADNVIDACGGMVLPCWCDPHTHIVCAGSREGEFVDKIRGLSYAEIAQRGGGILNSADRLHEMTEDELFEQSLQRLQRMVDNGTGWK